MWTRLGRGLRRGREGLDERKVGRLRVIKRNSYTGREGAPKGCLRVDQSIPSRIPFLTISLITFALRRV